MAFSQELRDSINDAVTELKALRSFFIKKYGNHCMLCGSQGRIELDHDHATGYIRGLLCRTCNLMLGAAKDREGLLIAGAAYLRRKGNVKERVFHPKSHMWDDA